MTQSSMTESPIERMLREKPAFHAWPDGTPAYWSVAGNVLRFIADQVQPGMNTLETGAGQTTVAFALQGANHICITPDREQGGRISAYLEPLSPQGSVTFIHESSDEVLPRGEGIPDRLDIVLIDGAHRFPFPIIDWYYTQARVPVGGLVIVDDFRMPSVRILHDFLEGEEEWELVKAFEVTSVFRRVKETVSQWDWADQQINKPHLERMAAKTQGNGTGQNGGRQKDLLGLFKRWLGEPK